MALAAAPAARTARRCPFPQCIREEHWTGEHRFGRQARPIGELRLLQKFYPAWPVKVPCDLCPASAARSGAAQNYGHLAFSMWRPPAQALYADACGFGWALCDPCYEATMCPKPTGIRRVK